MLNSGRETKIARLSNVYGLGMKPKNSIRQILQEAVNTGKVHFLTSTHSSKDFVSVSDVVHWLPQIALRDEHAIYNVASGKNTSNADIASFLQKNKIMVTYATDALKWSFPIIDTRRVYQEIGHAKKSMSNEFHNLYRSFSPSK